MTDTPDARLRETQLRFFRDLSTAERMKVYAVFGIPDNAIEEISSHATEHVIFKRLFGEALAARSVPEGWNDDMDAAPKDGTRIILDWDGKARVGYYLDNSKTSRPWQGWKVPSMEEWPARAPERWMPFPALAASPPGADNAQVAPAEPAEGEVGVDVRFIQREDGGLSVSSKTFPGLILSGSDAVKVAASIPVAINALCEHAGEPGMFRVALDREAATREAVIEALVEAHRTIRMWSGSAFVADEPMSKADLSRNFSSLYSDLCVLGNTVQWCADKLNDTPDNQPSVVALAQQAKPQQAKI